MSSHHDRQARRKFLTLLRNTGQGSTGFPRASQNIAEGNFTGKAITFELRAVKPNTRTSFLIPSPDGKLPPLRVEKSGHLTLPCDNKNRKAFIEWFFASLKAGRRIQEPLFQSNEVLTIDVPSRPRLVAVSHVSAAHQKAAKTLSTQPLADEDELPNRKRRPKNCILSDDEEETVDAPQPPNPPRKKGKPIVSLFKDSLYDYEDDSGNLAGFVIPDNVCY